MPKDCSPPPLTTVYPDPSTTFTTLQAHAKAHGYVFRARSAEGAGIYLWYFISFVTAKTKRQLEDTTSV